jgi:hypothetical protein
VAPCRFPVPLPLAAAMTITLPTRLGVLTASFRRRAWVGRRGCPGRRAAGDRSASPVAGEADPETYGPHGAQSRARVRVEVTLTDLPSRANRREALAAADISSYMAPLVWRMLKEPVISDPRRIGAMPGSTSAGNAPVHAQRHEPTLMRALLVRKHWQKFPAFEAQFRKSARELADGDGEPRLAHISISARQWERWYSGNLKKQPHPDACRVLEHMLGYPIEQLMAPARMTGQQHDARSAQSLTPIAAPPQIASADPIELLRQDLTDAITNGVMSEASLDYWERLAIRHGRATRDQSPNVLVGDIGCDLAELNRVLGQHPSVSARRRLTRVAAQMSGLMCLLFCILDDRRAFVDGHRRRGWQLLKQGTRRHFPGFSLRKLMAITTVAIFMKLSR